MALKRFNTAEAANQGIDVEIFDPTGVSTGIFFHVLGSDSQTYLDTERRIHNRQMEHGKRVKDFAAHLTYEQQQLALLEKVCSCVVSWKETVISDDPDALLVFKPSITLDDDFELPCTPENVKRILKDPGFFWIRNQVQAAMDNPKNFLPKAPVSSSNPPSSDTVTTIAEKMG